MNHWCEARVVVGREIGNCAGLLSPGVRLGIGAAHKPEDRRYLPLSSKRAKIFTRGSWLSVFHAVRREVAAKCIDSTLCRLWIILHKCVTVERSDLRLLRCPRCFCFGIDDAFDSSKHTLSDIFIESTHIQLYDCLVGDHILLCTGLKRADGYNHSIGWSDFARNNCLQAKHGCGGHNNWINAGLRHRTVRSSTEQSDWQVVSRGGDHARAGANYA